MAAHCFRCANLIKVSSTTFNCTRYQCTLECDTEEVVSSSGQHQYWAHYPKPLNICAIQSGFVPVKDRWSDTGCCIWKEGIR